MIRDQTSSSRVGVVGVGSFGSRHAIRYSQIEDAELTVICDVDAERARAMAERLGTCWTTDYRDVIGSVDAVSVAVPTELHFEVSRFLLEHGVHVLVEKPICDSLAQADELVELAASKQVVLQVGHLERFNPVVEAMVPMLDRPRRIEARRVSTTRGSDPDTNVTLDLMIHDIDLVLQFFSQPVRSIRAKADSGIGGPDSYASAQIEFGNGGVATILASWVGTSVERTMSVIQPDSTIVADFKNNRLNVLRASERGNSRGDPTGQTTAFGANTSLMRQLRSFVHAVGNAEPPAVSGADGRRALEVALTVIRKLGAGTGSEKGFRAA